MGKIASHKNQAAARRMFAPSDSLCFLAYFLFHLEHIHKFKLGAGKSLRMLQRGLFPSHEINLWI
jgi:hypothetical protein